MAGGDPRASEPTADWSLLFPGHESQMPWGDLLGTRPLTGPAPPQREPPAPNGVMVSVRGRVIRSHIAQMQRHLCCCLAV